MSVKSAKVVSNQIVGTPAPVVVAVAPAQRTVIVITEPTALAFAAAASLIRSGYVISPDAAPVVFPSTNHSTITLVRGNPSADAVAIAEAAESYAAAKHQVDFAAEVDAAATRKIAHAARVAADAARAVLVAEQKAALAKLIAEQAAAAAEQAAPAQ